MSHFEKNAIISGLGISRIGRRTGIPGAELTLAAARAAIEDAGLTPNDIDGIGTFGDTPSAEVSDALGIQATDQSFGFDTGGVLIPVMSACRAVCGTAGPTRAGLSDRRDAGWVDENQPASPMLNPLASPPVEPRTPGSATKAQAVRGHRRVGGRPLLLGRELAGDALPASHGALWNDERAVGLVGDQQQAQRRAQPACRVSGSDDHGRLPRRAPGVDTVRAVRLRCADRRLDRTRRLTRRLRGGLPEPAVEVEAIGGAYGSGGWFHRDDFPKMASVEAADEMWSRTDLAAVGCERRRTLRRLHVSHVRVVEALGICADGEAGPFVDGATRIALDGPLPLNTYGGQLSAGRMHGYWLLHEACLQLRGQAGERQLATPRGGRRRRRRRAHRRMHAADLLTRNCACPVKQPHASFANSFAISSRRRSV